MRALAARVGSAAPRSPNQRGVLWRDPPKRALGPPVEAPRRRRGVMSRIFLLGPASGDGESTGVACSARGDSCAVPLLLDVLVLGTFTTCRGEGSEQSSWDAPGSWKFD